MFVVGQLVEQPNQQNVSAISFPGWLGLLFLAGVLWVIDTAPDTNEEAKKALFIYGSPTTVRVRDTRSTVEYCITYMIARTPAHTVNVDTLYL